MRLGYLHIQRYIHVFLQDDTLRVIKQMHSCRAKKFFLQELCAVAVVQLVNDSQLTSDVIRDHVIPLVGVSSGWEGCTPARLYLALAFNKIVGKVCIVLGYRCGTSYEYLVEILL